jgi:hypothetical protein
MISSARFMFSGVNPKGIWRYTSPLMALEYKTWRETDLWVIIGSVSMLQSAG